MRYVSSETYKERVSRLQPQPGDVVYSREGGILGIACELPPDAKVCLGQRMMLMRSDSNRYSGTLLAYFLNSPSVVDRVRELKGESASPHLNVADVKNFVLPVPPLEEQAEILRIVQQKMTAIDNVVRQRARATGLLDRLDQAALAKAIGEDFLSAAAKELAS